MITRTIQITLFVEDQEEARKFYTEKLGFDVCFDMEFSPGWKYLTVAPDKNNQTMIELTVADTDERKALIGKQAANQAFLMFQTDDIEKDYREMKSRGITFHGAPSKVPGGKGVGFEDLYGNKFDLYQPDES